MTAIEAAGEVEKAKAEELVAAVPRMPEIEKFDVRLYQDWSGDPSLYVTFRIKANAHFDDAFFQRFNAYSEKVRMAILQSGISRFPYIEFQEAA